MDLATSSKYDLNIARSWISLFFFGFPNFFLAMTAMKDAQAGVTAIKGPRLSR